MSEDIMKAALQRIATLEQEVSGYRSRKEEPKAPAFNPQEFARAFTQDPIGTMSRLGIPVEHVNKVLVANAMGDQAPEHLKAMLHMGPQISNTMALQNQVETLSRQFSDFMTQQTKSGTRESFKTLTAQKEQYPHLAKALAADPTLFDEDLKGHGGSAEDFAKATETRLSKFAKLWGPQTASDENADTTDDQSQQVTPAVAASLNGEMPPIKQTKQGVFSQDDHARLRDEVVRKLASSQS